MSTILVVEDELSVRTYVARVLEAAGYKVVLASNGLEAISLFRSSPAAFDVVLTDLTMPVLDGHQLVHLVRETKSTAKIMCMSGYSENDLPSGVELLEKPFPPATLLTRLDELLHQS